MKKLTALALCCMLFSSATFANDSASYAEYYGKYVFAEGSPVAEVEVVWQDSMLNLTSAMGNATLEQTAVDSFRMDYMDGVVIFSRDLTTNKITGLTILVQGMALEAKKEDPDAEKAVGLKIPPRKESLAG